MPVVQRAQASETPDVQRVVTDGNSMEAPAPSPSITPAQNRAVSDDELTRAAQRILPIIKRMLAVERERFFGR